MVLPAQVVVEGLAEILIVGVIEINGASVAVIATAVVPPIGFTVFAPESQMPSTSVAVQPTMFPVVMSRCSILRTPF